MVRRGSACKFPVARIKKLMQADEDVGKVAQATPVAVCKALELFMQGLVDETLSEARKGHSKKLTAYHLKRAVLSNETFDFLKDIVEKVPDPTNTGATSSSGGAAAAPSTSKRSEAMARAAADGDDAEGEAEKARTSNGNGQASGVKGRKKRKVE